MTGTIPAAGSDIDTDDNGTIDAVGLTVVDSIAITDGTSGDLTYGGVTLGTAYDGLSFAPGGASRIPDGVDTDTTADWLLQRLRPRRHPEHPRPPTTRKPSTLPVR